MSSPPHKRKRKAPSASTAGAGVARTARRSNDNADDDDVIDLCSGSDDGVAVDSNATKRGTDSGVKGKTDADNNNISVDDLPPMNDTKLCGTHKLITLETAQQSIRLVADFVREEGEGKKSSVAFSRNLFDPLWQRLKDQGSGGSPLKSNSNRYCWKYENMCYVPPRSKKGTEGVLGRDYYVSEEHVALSVLEDISTLEEVSDIFTKSAHCFTAIIPVLDRAVTENVEYRLARWQDTTCIGASSSGNIQRIGTRSGGSRSDPYELSGDEKSAPEDENKDYCGICHRGGELVCCDNCDNAYHAECLRVEVDDLPDPWYCPSCSGSGESKMVGAAKSSDGRLASKSSHENQDESHWKSNLSGVDPKVDMPIEICDADFVWNTASITRVSYEKDESQNDKARHGRNAASATKCHVTVRYDGWGPDWDETLPYPNERLARIFTYTKKVKCFAVLLGSRKRDFNGKGSAANGKSIRNWSDTWPCTVSFRSPHPNNTHASDYLQTETKVLVEPYMAHLLPQAVQQQISFGGQWARESALRPWKDLNVGDPVGSSGNTCILHENSSGKSEGIKYHVSLDFCKAYHTAQSDWIRGLLPRKAILKGALLKDEYRVQNVGGDIIDGVRYSGAFPSKVGRNDDKDPLNTSLSSSTSNVTEASLNARSATKAPHVPSPLLPPPIPITDTAYPDQGVRRLPGSNRWASILRVAGNDLFLGSHASQSEAAWAAKLASAQSRRDNNENDSIDQLPHIPNFEEDSPFGTNAGKIADLLNTPIESIVSAFEATQPPGDQKPPPQPRFHLSNWMAQHYRHVQHVKNSGGQDISNSFSLVAEVKNDQAPKKRRKKSVPRRMHVPNNNS